MALIIMPCYTPNEGNHYYIEDSEVHDHPPTRPEDRDSDAYITYLEETIMYYETHDGDIYNTPQEAIEIRKLPPSTTVSASHGICSKHMVIRYQEMLKTKQAQ